MRVEEHYGRRIVCGHIYPADKIQPGQLWQGSSGSLVQITGVRERDVSYRQSDGTCNTKDSFSFQCRYCLVLNEGEEP